MSAARRFEFVEGGSKKFWEIAVDGCAFTVRYGRLGTSGQVKTKSFPTEDRARRDADKLIEEKLRKRYLEVTRR
ncbi:MAG: WGR domain-containing protein [Verrucomicrobiae bacterium]|nr:WGR domain-containing protein [Verrucomicrobiae bacterium]